MLVNTLEALESTLEGSYGFSQIKPYEGEFENLKNAVITPPACFIEIERGDNSNTVDLNYDTVVNLYPTFAHIRSKKPTNLFQTIDDLIDNLRGRRLTYETTQLGTLHFVSFARIALFKGFIVYQVKFILKGK